MRGKAQRAVRAAQTRLQYCGYYRVSVRHHTKFRENRCWDI